MKEWKREANGEGGFRWVKSDDKKDSIQIALGQLKLQGWNGEKFVYEKKPCLHNEEPILWRSLSNNFEALKLRLEELEQQVYTHTCLYVCMYVCMYMLRPN